MRENPILGIWLDKIFSSPMFVNEIDERRINLEGVKVMALREQELLEENEDTQHGRFLTFALGKEVFGIEIKHVIEIIGLQPITQMPEVPDYIKGIINLRGKIIPVIDIRLKFRMKPKEYDDRTCIVVIDILDVTVGLIVDNVIEVLMIQDENISQPPDHRAGIQNRYMAGIGKVGNEVKLLLSCEKLLLDDEIEIIKENILDEH
jgi:purine-binding chemotaxis protein CheW